MKKKLISLIAVGVLGVQALAVPMMASAEESVSYVDHSDFNDVSIGGANGTGYYGLGIIIDGSPWLSKGSASVHYQTFSYDEERKVNYCNFWTNSDKTGSGDGAGSMYFYNRNLTNLNQMGPYGLVEYDIRFKSDHQSLNFMMGWFEDATSSGFDAATTVPLSIKFNADGVTCNNGPRTESLGTLAADKWYKVRVTLDNNLEEFNVVITDAITGAAVSKVEGAAYSCSIPKDIFGIKTTCWGYVRGATYDFDMTNVTIAKSDTKFEIQ